MVSFFQVDAFTARAFAGNPAAVCLLDEPADEAWMQAVAADDDVADAVTVEEGDDRHRVQLGRHVLARIAHGDSATGLARRQASI